MCTRSWSRSRGPRVRLSAVEYGTPVPIVAEIANLLNVDRDVAIRHVRACNRRLARLLHLRSTPLSLDGDEIRIRGVAGLVRVAPRVEIEAAPKFLDAKDQRWREDFFYIATLSRHGHILAGDDVGASPASADDLTTLVARSFVAMYWANHRRPLRTYRRAEVVRFPVDGDADPQALFFPTEEGFRQRVITFDRRNQYNETILAAAKVLLPEVREPGTRGQLSRLIDVLAPQRPPRRVADRRLPSRARRWQVLHDLAVDVLQGLGLAFEPGRYGAPGFAIDTAKAWEDLVTLGLRIAFGAVRTRAQRGLALGQRFSTSSSRPVNVKPDVVLTFDGSDRLVLDAKYKGRGDDDGLALADGDIYQSLAFARASGCSLVMLLYPSRGTASSEPGSMWEVDRTVVDATTVVRVAVVPGGISRRGGLRSFASNLEAGVRELASRYGCALPQ